MKTLMLILALTAASYAEEVPLQTPAAQPQAALLFLPLQYTPSNQSDSNTTTPDPRTAVSNSSLTEDSARSIAMLAQEQGSQAGVFYVYLPNGQLQRVQYTTAPVSQQQRSTSNDKNVQQAPNILSPEFASRRGVYFVQVPQERIRQLQAADQQRTQAKSADDADQQDQTNQQLTSNEYRANIRYSTLEPIQGPVYSYNPDTLVRIIRYAPQF